MKRILTMSAALALLAGPVLAQPMANSQHQVGPGMDHPAMGPPQNGQHGPEHMQMGQPGTDHAGMATPQHDMMAPQQHENMAAPQHQDYPAQHEANTRPQGNWHRGQHYGGQRQVITDWGHHHLHRPPHGYEWVQSGNDYVLIAVSTGIIASIIAAEAQ